MNAKTVNLVGLRSDKVIARVEKMGDLFAPVEKLKQKLPKKWKL